MTERSIDSAMWTNNEWFQLKPPLHKYLFIYLWTNDHCNSAGLYEITLKTISDETGLPLSDIPQMISDLNPKIKWWPEKRIIWVVNFLRRQTKSPKFLKAVGKCLEKIHDKEICSMYLYHNDTLSIPYGYPIDTVYKDLNVNDTVSIPSISDLFCSDNISSNNIYSLYEQNFGLITEYVAEELKLLENDYGEELVMKALKIAIDNNARKLSYVRKVLSNGHGELNQKQEKEPFDYRKAIREA